MIDTDKPVRLRRAPEMVGKATRHLAKATLTVQFNGGGVGRFPEEDLENCEPPEGKAWPPAGLEHK